jgi:repressor LexA
VVLISFKGENMKYGLTNKQLKLFNYIKSYMKKKPIAPSYEEMKVAVGLKSKSGIGAILQQLEDRKWIKKLTGKHRSIQINR